jgi:hypothetical protein
VRLRPRVATRVPIMPEVPRLPDGVGEQVAKFARFVDDFLRSDITHRVRASVLESAASLEFDINEAIAADLSRNIFASYELAVNVLSRLPMDVRLDMLERHMEETGADELWPTLVPVMRKLYEVRNRYAHGYVTSDPDGSITISSWNRGKTSAKQYGPEELTWLAYAAVLARTDLARLWAYWVPFDLPWHEPRR